MRTVSLILVLFICSIANADVWTWTPNAEWHKAIGTIQIGSAGGTATYFSTKTGSYIVSCGHVGRGTGTFTWHDGSTATIRPLFVVNQNLDMAVFSVSRVPANTYPIPLSAYDPPIGAIVEVCGFGGPGGKGPSSLRHFESKVTSYEGGRCIMTAPLLSGDSGGPIIYDGRIVGVNNGGRGTRSFGLVNSGGDWKLHSPAITTTSGSIRSLLGWSTQDGGGQYCGPGGCPPSPQGRGGGGNQPNFTPPIAPPVQATPPVQAAPSTPITDMAPVQPQKPVDTKPDTTANDSLKAEIAEIKELIKSIPAGKTGATGKTGVPGPVGKNGSDATVKPFMVYVYDKHGRMVDSAEVDLMSNDPDKRDIHLRFVEE